MSRLVWKKEQAHFFGGEVSPPTSRPDLLVLDDFGLKPLRGPGAEDLYDVINERYEKVSILLTSNRDRAEWPDLFGEALLASAASQRALRRDDGRQLPRRAHEEANRDLAEPGHQLTTEGNP